jgi:TRAP-type C4-dicarboxylate transport system permease small subunit
LFTFFISITGYLTIIYQWKLLKGTPEKEVRLLDNPDSAAHHKRGWMYSIYLSFSVLIIGLGVFLVAKPLQENYPIEKLPDGLVPYFIVLILTGLGMVLFYDVIKIKRIPKETNQ